MKSRQLKVYEKTRSSADHIHIVPEIRLQGQWLARAGFATGQAIRVEVRNGLLVIQKQDALDF